MSWRILEGDVRDRLADLATRSVQCVVTSPPYFGLRDYGHAGQIGLEATPDEYVAALVEVFRGVGRVLRDDGVVWLNLGDSYAANAATARGRAGFESARGSDTPTLNRGHQGRTAIRGNRIKGKDLLGVPWMVAFALRADGWYLRQEVIWHKTAPMPESVRDRCTRAHEQVFMLSKSARYFYDADAIREENQLSASGWAKTRPEITAKTSGNGETSQGFSGTNRVGSIDAGRNKRSVWTLNPEPFPGAHFAVMPTRLVEPCILAGSSPKACGECGAPWLRVVEHDGGDTEAAARPKRTAGMNSRTSTLSLSGNGSREWAQRGGRTRTVGWEPSCLHHDDTGRCVVLDPFAGAGTVGVVALRHHRSFVGIELNPGYAELARRRICDDAPLLNTGLEEAA